MYICLPCGVYPYERMANLFMSTMIFCYAAAVEARLMVRVMHIINGPIVNPSLPGIWQRSLPSHCLFNRSSYCRLFGGFLLAPVHALTSRRPAELLCKKTVAVENWTGTQRVQPSTTHFLAIWSWPFGTKRGCHCSGNTRGIHCTAHIIKIPELEIFFNTSAWSAPEHNC